MQDVKDRGLGWLVLCALLLIALAAGCSKSTGGQQAAAGAGAAPEVKLSAMAPTSDAQASGIVLGIEPAAGGFDVQAAAGAGMKEAKDLFFRLEYDADALHSYNIKVDGVKPNDGVMGLAVEKTPGVIDVGLVAARNATGPAVSPGAALVSFRLLSGAGRRTSDAGGDDDINKARHLTLGQSEGGQWVLSWDYTNPGDTNQDGQVGMQDLMPIGAHYGEDVEDQWSDPLRHVDCDHNGVINVGDVVRIGQNYSNRVFAYQIEMSQDGTTGFTTVGQLLLSEADKAPGQTIRFNYAFPVAGGQTTYIENMWYRVVTLSENLEFGVPSDPICQVNDSGEPATGETVVVVLCADNLDPDKPFAHLNSARVIYPSSYEYVVGSANTGSFGGARDYPDGIWSTFCTGVLFPPDSMIQTTDMGGGKTALDLGMASLFRTHEFAQVRTGDVINFKLKNNGSDPLTIEFQKVDDIGIKRTYYCDNDGNEYWFDDHLKYAVYK
jgi:hypothetical protein